MPTVLIGFQWKNGIFTEWLIFCFYGKLVGRYSNPMDGMGYGFLGYY